MLNRRIKTTGSKLLKIPGKIGAVKKRYASQIVKYENNFQEMENPLTPKEHSEQQGEQLAQSILELIPENARQYIYFIKKTDKVYPNNKIVIDNNIWGWGHTVILTDEDGTPFCTFITGDIEDRRRKHLRKSFTDSVIEWQSYLPIIVKSKHKNKQDFVIPSHVSQYIPEEYHKDFCYYIDGFNNKITCTVMNGVADSLCFRDINGKPIVTWGLNDPEGTNNDGTVGASLQEKLERYFKIRQEAKYSTRMVPVSNTRVPEWILNAIPSEYWHRITSLSVNKEWPDQVEPVYHWPFLFTTSEHNIRLRLAPPASFSQDVFIDFKLTNTKEAIDKKLEELKVFFSIYKEMYVTPFQKFKTEVYEVVDDSKEKKISYGGTLNVVTLFDKTAGTSEMFFFDKRTEMLISHEYYNEYGLHNQKGPATIRFSNDGSISSKQFFIDGKSYLENDWNNVVSNRFESLTSRNKVQNLGGGSTGIPVVTGLTTGLTGITLHQTLGKTAQEVKTMSKLEKVKEIAKSDAKIVAKRVAVEKISQVLQKALVEIMTRNLKGKQKSALAKNLVQFFDTEKGRAVLQFFAGVGLPMIASHIPNKYHHILEEVSTEFRVQGETTVMLEAIGAVQPLIMMATSGMLDAFRSSVEEETETNVRVHVDTVTHNSHAEHELEAAQVLAANKASK